MKIMNATDVPNLICPSSPQFSCLFGAGIIIAVVFIAPGGQKPPD